MEYRRPNASGSPNWKWQRITNPQPGGFAHCLQAIRTGTGQNGFYWRILPELWTYATNRIGEVADTFVEIDRAMKAGFNWELGPFEMWDAAGFAETIEKMRAGGQAIPKLVETMLAAGNTGWYRDQGEKFFDVRSGTYRDVVETPGTMTVARIKRVNGVVEKILAHP